MLTQPLLDLRRVNRDRIFGFYETKYRRSIGSIDSTNMSTNFLGHLVLGWMKELSYLLGGAFLLCAAGG